MTRKPKTLAGATRGHRRQDAAICFPNWPRNWGSLTARWRENTLGHPATSAWELAQARTCWLVGQIAASPCNRVSLEGSVALNVVARLSQLQLRPARL